MLKKRNIKSKISPLIKLSLLKFISETVGSTYRIDKIYGGLVHDVYKIRSRNISYLKIRGKCFSMIPSLSINPKDIQHEKEALKIFSDLLPNIFPTVLGFNKKLSAIIMTDVNPSGITLKDLFEQGKVSPIMMKKVGINIGKTHYALRKITNSIRLNKDEDYYKRNFSDRLLKFNYLKANAFVSDLIEELRKMPRQLILSDLSPKNIGISKNNKISFFDLECVHRGNTVFDLGFLLGHIILHSKNNSDLLIRNTLNGYAKYVKNPINYRIIEKIMGLTILYRLKNEVIPYPLHISYKEKEILIKKGCRLLGISVK